MSKKPVKATAASKAAAKKKKEATERKASADKLRKQAEQALFLKDLARGQTVSSAARGISVSRACVYKWREENTSFRAAWDEAVVEGVHTLEDEARRRAVDGVPEPIIKDGEIVGERIKYSDSLLMFLLKAKDPDTYNPAKKVEMSGHLLVGEMTDEQIDSEIQRLASIASNG